MPWTPDKQPTPNVTGGSWRPRDTVIAPPDSTPGWWVRTPVAANFSGSGALAAQMKQISYRDIFLNSEGTFDPSLFQKYFPATDFSGEGAFVPQVMQREFRQVNFNGDGYIVFECVSIISDDKDGLTATAYERYPAQPQFAGAGSLEAAVRGYATMIANLSGGGQLSGEITKQLYAMTVSFAGGGALTAGAVEGVARIAEFLGAGTLSAAAWQAYLRSFPASGAGALSAFLNEQYPQLAGATGEGTMTATIMQRYLIPMDLIGDGVLSGIVFKKEFRNVSETGNGVLTATTAFPTKAPQTDTYSTAGAYTYTIPYWCRYIDVIGLGGGGGGEGGGNFNVTNGKGGGPGIWDYTTWERGVHIPWTTSQITGVVGAAGTAGSNNLGNGGNGGASTINATGAGPRSAAGGSGGGSGGNQSGDQNGAGSGNAVVQGITYPGSSASSGAGIAPGGGGGGGNGNLFGNGASGSLGARGQVWFRAWQ